jgi:signal transduction histidine kinase
MLRERALTAALIVPTTILVVTLAVVQYRWSNQVSAATSLRLADSLQMSMTNWHLNLFRDLSDLCPRLQVDSRVMGPHDLDQLARRVQDWRASAPYPDVVAQVYIVPVGAAPLDTLALDPRGTRFIAVARPDRLARTWETMQAAATAVPGGVRAPGIEYARGGLDGWRFEQGVPALLRPVTASRRLFPGASAPTEELASWVVIALDPDVIRSRILPDLAKRYFSGVDGLDYQVAVVAGRQPRRVLYASDPGFGAQDPVDADGRMNLFGRAVSEGGHSPIYVFHATSEDATSPTTFRTIWLPLLTHIPQTEDWQLIVRHRRGGSLGAFVAQVHQRDLMISFGLLLLLVISMAMWIIAANRARRLAKVQMDFVTAVSHELRTPLTIISSAADNLALGCVEPQQLTRYGGVIGNQARKLSELVEQVLLFASTRDARHRYALRPVDVSDVIQTTLAASEELIQASKVVVERDVDPVLPPVLGDALGLAQCLQNLITNALKYGGTARWLGLRAVVADRGDGRVVEITVADRGVGIAPADLPHIFKPFYRSPAVVAAHIHGTGLGLALARRIAEAMRGELTVNSRPEGGTAFTLRVPCAPSPTPGETPTEVRVV